MSVLKIKDPNTKQWLEITTIEGPPGPRGEDYILTEEDKVEIAQLALEVMPAAEEGEY